MDRFSLKGIILAILLMLMLDTISGVALMGVMGSHVFQEGLTDQQMNEAIAALTHNRDFLLWSLILGTLSTIVAGYVAARIAKREHYLNAGIVGVLGIVMGLIFSKDYPLWFNVLGFLLVLPAALLGGYFAKARIEHNA